MGVQLAQGPVAREGARGPAVLGEEPARLSGHSAQGPFPSRPTDEEKRRLFGVRNTEAESRVWGTTWRRQQRRHHIRPVPECSPGTSPGGRESPPQPRWTAALCLRPLSSFLCYVKEERAFPLKRKSSETSSRILPPAPEPSRFGVFADGLAETCPPPTGDKGKCRWPRSRGQ